MKVAAPRTDTRIGVVIPAFSERYIKLAYDKALPSAVAAGADIVLVSVEADLRLARNLGALRADHMDWLVFLDADDEIAPDYISALQRRIEALPPGDFVIQPATEWIVDGVTDGPPSLIRPQASLWEGNHCVIGSALPVSLFERVDGFDDWPAWEDWGLWLKCMKAGATFTTCPEAVYRIHVDSSTTSRNQISDTDARMLFDRMTKHYRSWEALT